MQTAAKELRYGVTNSKIMPLSLSIQSRLQYQHYTIEEMIKDHTEDQLRTRTIPGKWSPFENIAHLVRYQVIFKERVDKIVTTGNPSFDRYVAETDPEFNPYLQHSLFQLLQSLGNTREEIFKTLTTFTDRELARIGEHPKFGPLSLVQWSEFFLLHEAHHLFTLFTLLYDQEKRGHSLNS
ncbi:MAG: DinB family protein [Flavitalea sp.]